MTLEADIRDAWVANVFANINDGENSYDYIINPEADSDLDKAYYNARIDFWMFEVRGRVQFLLTKKQMREITVRIVRVLENDHTGETHKEIIDDIQDLLVNVQTNLGETWSNNVQFWQAPEVIDEPRSDFWGSDHVWISEIEFTAETLENTI